jgi:hypothetical protein
MPLKNLSSCLLSAALATCVLTTGCQPQGSVQPAQNETVIYNKWEVETHRPHKDINQRPPEEQKEYHDWRQKNPNVH